MEAYEPDEEIYINRNDEKGLDAHLQTQKLSSTSST